MTAYEAITLPLAIFAFIFAYLSSETNENHAPLQILFLISSVLTISFGTLVTFQVAETAGYTNISGMFGGYVNAAVYVIPTIVIFYIIIYYMWKVLHKMLGKDKEGW